LNGSKDASTHPDKGEESMNGKWMVTVLTAALMAALLAACAPAPATGGVPLEGSFWVLDSYYSADGVQTSVLPRTQLSAQFEGGKVSGSDGCNNYFGEYVLEGDQLTFGEGMGSTMMACEEPVMEQASSFMQALQATASFSISGETLTLKNEAGQALLVFTAASQELAGSSWDAVAVNNGKQAMVSLITGSAIDADFGEDGTISGSAGCNRYNGPFVTEGKQIQIGPVASTMMACIEPEGVAEQEAAYLAALENATVYELRGTNLTLRDGEGAAQVEFVRK
jgi:heat shock protein HslJ